MGWGSGVGRRGRKGLATLGPRAGGLHRPLSGVKCSSPSAGWDAGRRRVGCLRRRRSARSTAVVAPPWIDGSVADSPGEPVVPGTVCGVRSVVLSRALLAAGAIEAPARHLGGDV